MFFALYTQKRLNILCLYSIMAQIFIIFLFQMGLPAIVKPISPCLLATFIYSAFGFGASPFSSGFGLP